MESRTFMTLCLVHQPPLVLLGMKKRGFGAGRWNGFGGKVKAGERIVDAARRELREEAGLEVAHMEEVGVIDFEFYDQPAILEVHIFRTHECPQQPHETEEMKPSWFHETELPFDQMWPDDRLWLPLFLSGQRFRGYCLFADEETILKYHFKVFSNSRE